MKGTKVLITTGLVIVFISVFFTLFLIDRIFISSADCRFDIVSEKNVCIITDSSLALTGILLIGLFSLITILVSYILISIVMSKRSICFGSAAVTGVSG
ncbi:MAG: hypothetical protein FJY76_04345 [Candidatus Aenigmarchaeota archaeon]|nr:hypothetical protein [Candidatus Aenigmarchaeota archaeon]